MAAQGLREHFPLSGSTAGTLECTGFGAYFLICFHFLKRIQWQKSHFHS